MEDGNHELLVEFDNENVVDNPNILDNENVEGDASTVPKVGMMFTGEKEMFNFYKRYAYAVGFPVRKRNSKKGEDGVMRYVTFTCSREGRRTYATSGSLRPQPTSQTDCKARISASLDTLGIWRINKVYLDHNHKTSPSKSRLYRCNRKLSASVKRKLEVNDIAGIPLHKSYNSAVVEAGGYENTTFVEKDCRNFEFRGIICRHAIAVFLRNDITQLPAKYIIRRWRRDVSRAHSRIAVNYDGLVSSPGQLRYDDMCQAFSEVADLATDDEGWARNIMDWIKSQVTELRMTKSSVGSAIHLQNTCSKNLLDPKSSNRNGAPKKLRRKSPLECSSKRVQGTTSKNKGKRPRATVSNTEEGSMDVQASQLR